MLDNKHLQITPLVGYGLALLLAIVLWLAVGWMSDQVDQNRDSVVRLQNELAVVESLQDTSLWESRYEQSVALRESIEKKIWQAETASLVSAQLQASLREHAAEAGLQNVRVQTDPDVQSVNGVQLIRFEFTANAQEALDVFDALLAMSEDGRRYWFDYIDMSLNANNQSLLRLSGSVPISIGRVGSDEAP